MAATVSSKPLRTVPRVEAIVIVGKAYLAKEAPVDEVVFVFF